MATVTTSQMYDFLYAFFSSKTYPSVTYNPDTRARIVGADAEIASLELNEESSTFSQARNHRSDLMDHSIWTWAVQLRFYTEVDFANIRDALSRVPHLQGARVLLQRIKYTHPPRQEPNTGSKAEFVLNVLVHPL